MIIFLLFYPSEKKQPKIGKKRKLDSFFAIQRTEPLERAKKNLSSSKPQSNEKSTVPKKKKIQDLLPPQR